MSWVARIGFFILFLLIALALQSRPQPAAPQALENFKDDWPAPDEDSIEYVKGIDLRTLQPREGMAAGRVDLFGDPLPAGAITRLCFSWGVSRLTASPDGRLVAIGGPPCGPRPVEIFETATGRCLRRLGSFRGIIEGLAFSPDSRRLAVARSDLSGRRDLAGNITLYDLETFDELASFGEGTGPRCLAFSPDGLQLASGGGDGCLWLWHADTVEPVRQLADVTRKIVALAYSPDGKRLASASSDEIIRIWDVASGSVLQQIDQEATALVFSPDGRHLASQDRVWDLESGQELARYRQLEPGSAIAFSPDGRTLAIISDRQIRLHELSNGQVRRRFDRSEAQGSYRRAIAFTPDGRAIISGEQWGDALVWNVTGFDGPPEAARPSDIEALLDGLADGQGGRAYSAVWGLVLAGDAVVPSLVRHLQEPPPGPLEPACLKRLIAGLDDQDFQVRQRSTHELERMGVEAEKALRALLAERPPLEVRIRAEQVLARIVERGGRLPQEMFRLRAVEVLEYLGTPAARQALAQLAGREGDPVLKEDASQSLERLRRRAK